MPSKQRVISWLTLGLIALVLLVVGFGASDRAKSAQEAQLATEAQSSGASLTVYSDLALIQEQRLLTLTKGLADYRLSGISDRLLPDSVYLEIPKLASTADLVVAEQRYQHAQLSLDRLLATHLGQPITVYAPGGAGTYRGRLLSTQGGIVLEDENGLVRVIKDATRFTFPSYRVVHSPQLLLKLDSPVAGPHPVQLSYLSGGLQWQVSYRGILNTANTQMDLESTASLSNRSGLDFKEARLTLVAGQLHRARQPRPISATSLEQKAFAPPAPFAERPSFEYHRYQLARPVNLPNGQTVQLAFVSRRGISVEKRYLYEAQISPGVQVHILFTNPDAQDQGVALPAGLFRLYQRDPDGLLQFVGEDRIAHTPQGGQIELTAGTAFDLSAKRVRTAHESLGNRTARDSYEIMLTNRKSEAVTIEVREHLRGDWQITQAQPEYTKLDAATIAFTVVIPAGGTTTIKYTVEYRF